jgi:hypothetical protein
MCVEFLNFEVSQKLSLTSGGCKPYCSAINDSPASMFGNERKLEKG